VLRAPAAVLGSLVTQIALVGRGVRDVTRPDVVHHGLADLREVRSEAVHESQDEEHAHDGPMVAALSGRRKR
jgi:hypothetical protein